MYSPKQKVASTSLVPTTFSVLQSAAALSCQGLSYERNREVKCKYLHPCKSICGKPQRLSKLCFVC